MEKPCLKIQETLSAYCDGEVPPAERAALEEHLATCPECREQLEWFQWTGEVIRGLPEREPGAALQECCREDFKREMGLSRRKGGFPKAPWLGWAAAVAASVLLLLGLHLWLRPPEDRVWGPWTNASASVATRVLDDGSTVRIAPGARVAWRLDSHRRVVVLYDGEVGLEVRPEARPFRVQTPSGKVDVVGTRFRVKVFRFSSDEEAGREPS